MLKWCLVSSVNGRQTLMRATVSPFLMDDNSRLKMLQMYHYKYMSLDCLHKAKKRPLNVRLGRVDTAIAWNVWPSYPHLNSWNRASWVTSVFVIPFDNLPRCFSMICSNRQLTWHHQLWLHTIMYVLCCHLIQPVTAHIISIAHSYTNPSKIVIQSVWLVHEGEKERGRRE